MIKNLTGARRLALGFALLVVLNSIAAVIFIFTLRSIKQEVGDIAKDALLALAIDVLQSEFAFEPPRDFRARILTVAKLA